MTYYWIDDGDSVSGPFTEYGDIAQHLEDQCDVDVFQHFVTPDLLVALDGGTPLPLWDDENIVWMLMNGIYCEVPVTGYRSNR